MLWRKNNSSIDNLVPQRDLELNGTGAVTTNEEC